jgi:hypothetical protein
MTTQIQVLPKGLQEAVEVIDFTLQLTEGIKLAKADGVINFADLQYVFPLLDSGNKAVKDAEEIPAAWKAATDDEKEVVYNYFANKFDIADDVLESKIEKAVRAGYLLIDLFN